MQCLPKKKENPASHSFTYDCCRHTGTAHHLYILNLSCALLFLKHPSRSSLYSWWIGLLSNQMSVTRFRHNRPCHAWSYWCDGSLFFIRRTIIKKNKSVLIILLLIMIKTFFNERLYLSSVSSPALLTLAESLTCSILVYLVSYYVKI